MIPRKCVWMFALLLVAIAIGLSQQHVVQAEPANHPYDRVTLPDSWTADEQLPASPSTSTSGLEYIGHFGGSASAVASNGAYVYLAQGPQLAVLSVATPSTPVVVGRTPLLPYTFDDLVAVGDYVYAAAYEAGLRIFDVSDPSMPKEVGAFDTEGYANVVTISGSYAYIADGWAGLRIISILDPTQPVEVGDSGVDSYAVAVSSGYAYVSDNDGLVHILDISNPASPLQIGWYNTPGMAQDIEIAGSVAYVADYNNGLRVLDITNPARPVEIGSYLYSGEASELEVNQNLVYIVDRWGSFEIVDVINPRAPISVASYSSGSAIASLAVTQPHLYLSGGEGLRIISVANPSSPVEVGSYKAPAGVSILRVEGSYGYAGSSTGLHILDISNPQEPRQVSHYQTPESVTGLVVRGDYAYVTAWDSGLHIVDVTDRTRPREVGFLNTLGTARDVAVQGNYAYVASGDAGVRVVDISDPGHPLDVGLLNVLAYRIVVSGAYAYATDSNVLRIIKISNPERPTQVSNYNVAGYAEGVAVSGNYAYVAALDKGLRVIDVSDPAAPAAASFYDTPGSANEVLIVGNYAYVCDGAALLVFDISDPLVPTLVASFEVPGGVTSSAAQNQYVYVGGAGLTTLRFAASIADTSITSFTPGSGPAGTAVTINGTNLTGVTAVHFNGTPAISYSVSSPSRIDATVPAGATAGSISVTTPTGTASSQRIFTVTPVGTWTPLSVGTGSTGNTSVSGQTISIQGSSGDVWSTADSFHYACRTAEGDLDLIMRLDQWNAAGVGSAKTGLMLRASGDPDAPHIAIHVTGPDRAIKMKVRKYFGDTTTSVNGPSTASLPLWLRLKKVDATVTAYYSTDGRVWTTVGEPQALANLGSTFLSGAFVASNSAQTASASFTVSSAGEPASTIYLSPTSNGTLTGRSFTGADILSYVRDTGTWGIFYDGSYIKTPKNIGAFAFQGDDILLGFSAAQVVPGLGTTAAAPQDLVRFTPTRSGYNNTAGTFAWFFDGSDVGLTTSGEIIDALWIDAAGKVYISTTGAGAVPQDSANPTGLTVKFQDEDVLRFTPRTTGATTSGTWSLYWDPTGIPGMSVEDVNGYSEDPTTGHRYVTILGAFSVGNVTYGGSFTGNGKTILRFAPNAAVPGGWAPAEKVVWLAANGYFPSNIDGIEMGR